MLVALIPARGGSRRIPEKNTRPLGGVPLLSRKIAQVQNADWPCFVSTESRSIAELAERAGAQVIVRPQKTAKDTSPDIQWLLWALKDGRIGPYDELAIVRCTAPFFGEDYLRAAYAQWRKVTTWRSRPTSLRVIRPVHEHPYKMWRIVHGVMRPVVSEPDHPGAPYHSRPTQTLPRCYVQTGALEIVKRHVVTRTHTHSGSDIVPFLVEGPAGLDLNTEDDWREAERLLVCP